MGEHSQFETKRRRKSFVLKEIIYRLYFNVSDTTSEAKYV